MSHPSKTVTRERPLVVSAERSEDSRSESERSVAETTNGRGASPGPADNQTLERPSRRQFTEAYKIQILEQADALADIPGGIGALLRREGLYSSHLATWRKARKTSSLQPKRRGPEPSVGRAEAKQVQKLERQVQRLEHQLKKANIIIAYQKKLHELLNLPLPQVTESLEDPQ